MHEHVDVIADRIRAARPSLTVIGDVLLDRWTAGHVVRISREAPVPVIDIGQTVEQPGGAANAAVNLAALGARVRLVGVVGDDADGVRIRQLLTAAAVDTTGLVIAPGARTLSKTRLVGDDQVLLRADTAPLPAELARVDLHAEDEPPAGGTVLVCDYGLGTLPDTMIATWNADRPVARIIVDAHDLRRWRPVRPDIVTPNWQEVQALLGARLPGTNRADAACRRAADIIDASGARSVVVTLDGDGSVTLDRNSTHVHRTATRRQPDSQSNGAGDTFAAALATALAVASDLPDAADFAQCAADVVMSQPTTSVCFLTDLSPEQEGSARRWSSEHARLCARVRAAQAGGRRVVFTNGCFDILHPGHIAYLQQAKELGDVLVVGVNDDASVRRLKGPERPVNPLADRMRVLSALECVDEVVDFGTSSPAPLLRMLRPQLYVKGGDYTPDMLPETGVVHGYGGEVRILDYFPHYSTTSLIQRISHDA